MTTERGQCVFGRTVRLFATTGFSEPSDNRSAKLCRRMGVFAGGAWFPKRVTGSSVWCCFPIG